MIEIYIPNFKLTSISNASEHWTKRKQRVDREHKLIWAYLSIHLKSISLPVKIKLTRIAPRLLDDDNFKISFKNIKDKIAHMFFPHTKMGMADAYDCFEWEYEQIKGKTHEYGIRIKFSNFEKV